MNPPSRASLLASFLIALWLALPSTASAQQATAAAAPSAASPARVAAADEYRLAAGDLLRISVFQNPELTLEARVTEGGQVSFPLLGQVRLGGLAIGAAEKLIADGLRGGNFVRNPQVTVALLQARGHQASVLGQVNKPGRYALEASDMRLTDVLALAGGTAASGADSVVVSGTRAGKPFRAEVDLPTVFAANGRERDLPIQHGDVIWVERQPQVYIYGEVQRPGALRLERGMTVLQVLAAGGGLTQRGTERGVRVHRRGSDGATAVIEPRMSDRVNEGDVVFVRESLF
jgi:polysaccharide biosynthesis/export protein